MSCKHILKRCLILLLLSYGRDIVTLIAEVTRAEQPRFFMHRDVDGLLQ